MTGATEGTCPKCGSKKFKRVVLCVDCGNDSVISADLKTGKPYCPICGSENISRMKEE